MMIRWTVWLMSAVLGTMAVPAEAVSVGQPAPSFSLRQLNGGRLSLRDFRGKVVLLSFWTAGCPPCNAEAPHLQRLHQKQFGPGLRVVSVAPWNGTVQETQKFARRYRITYPTLLDPGEVVVRRYRIEAYPLTVLIDRRGVVRWVHHGFRAGDEAVMERQVQRVLRRG